MSINTLYPPTKPSLMLDFANAKRLDPRITFTRTTTATYFNANGLLVTAPSGVARFNHNPATGQSVGLLIEQQSTNLLTHSEQFDNAAWVKSASSISANTAVAPDGTTTADTLVEDNANASHSAAFRTGVSTTTNTAPITVSCFMKASTRTIGAMFIVEGTTYARNSRAWFDLSAGTATAPTNAGGAGSSSTSIAPVGNGWYRCTLTTTLGGSDTRVEFRVYPATTTASLSHQGDGASGIFVWGAQIEATSVPTSYIPTTTTTVIRNADAISMTGTNFSSWYNSTEGTLFADINPRELAVTSGFQLNNNTTDNRIRLALNSTSDQGLITTSGAAQATLDGGTPTANADMKLALAYKADDFALSLNGGTVATDTGGTVPVVNQLQIGAETSTVGNVTVRKIAYYPVRCTNAQLQAITT